MTEQATLTEENFEELFDQHMANVKSFNNQLVKGKIIKLTKDHVLVDVGLKSEGVIPRSEFVDENNNPIEIAEGEMVEVYIENYENRDGIVVLSKEKALREAAWHKLEELFHEGTLVEGYISKRVKGGFMVLLKNTIAFLPGSQLDIRPTKNINALVGTTQMLKIIAMDRRRYNLVVSRRVAIEEQMKSEGISLTQKFHEGQVVEGVVKNITGYGCFVDLGPCDGLLHIIDISWSRINHPSEVLKVGQTINVKIIKIHPETERISLGMKQISEDPWFSVEQKYALGTKHPVTITNVTDYGYFAELEKGIEGLIHISEVSWDRSNSAPTYKIGDTAEVVILDIDAKRRRISLSLKHCLQNPWLSYAEEHPQQSVVACKIRSVDDMGIVVELTDQITGFIRYYDLAWTNGKAELDNYRDRVGETISARILKYDLEKEKAYLGIKQLTEDTFSAKADKYKRGDLVEGTVVDINDFALTVSIEEDLNAVIKRGDLSLDREQQKTSNFRIGDHISAIIINIDKNDRMISLSIRALEQNVEKQYLNQQETASLNLADVLDDAINKGN